MAKKTPEPATPADRINALISALGHDPADVVSLDITGRHVRVFYMDRSMRTHKVDWRPKKEAASE